MRRFVPKTKVGHGRNGRLRSYPRIREKFLNPFKDRYVLHVERVIRVSQVSFDKLANK